MRIAGAACHEMGARVRDALVTGGSRVAERRGEQEWGGRGKRRGDSWMDVGALGDKVAAAKAALCDAYGCTYVNLALAAAVLIAHLVYTKVWPRRKIVCDGDECVLK